MRTGNPRRLKSRKAVLEQAWADICARLAEVLPETAMREWIDCFQLTRLTKKKAVVLYTGNGHLVIFWQRYYGQFKKCVFESLKRRVAIDFQTKSSGQARRQGTLKKLRLPAGLLLAGAAMLFAVVGMSALKNRQFRETFYQVSSGKISGTLRIIQISDLHATVFGGKNDELVRRIGLLQPDLIVLTGDCIEQNDEGYEVTLDLCRRLAESAPLYYIYGNDEATKAFDCPMTLTAIDELLGCGEEDRDAEKFRALEDPLRDSLEAAGVRVLLNEIQTVTVRGNTVDIYGVLTSNPSAFWPYAEESYGRFLAQDEQNFKLMACHEPYIFETFSEAYWADLTLCGHTHGGVIRIPWIGGLYERANGLLPELLGGAFIYGEYGINGYPLIVSSGLSNRGVVRINNQPEIAVIDVNRY